MDKCLIEVNQKLKELERKRFQLNMYEESNDTFISLDKNTLNKENNSDYNFDEIKKEIAILDDSVRYLKSSLSTIYLNTKLEEFNMSLYDGLIYFKQLKSRLRTLSRQAFKDKVSKQIINKDSSETILVKEINYDLDKAKLEYKRTLEEFNKLELGINKLFISTTIELDQYREPYINI